MPAPRNFFSCSGRIIVAGTLLQFQLLYGVRTRFSYSVGEVPSSQCGRMERYLPLLHTPPIISAGPAIKPGGYKRMSTPHLLEIGTSLGAEKAGESPPIFFFHPYKTWRLSSVEVVEPHFLYANTPTTYLKKGKGWPGSLTSSGQFRSEERGE